MSSHKPTNTSKADNQESALHKASSYGHGEVVKALVEAKANVDVQDKVRRGWGQRCRERECVYVCERRGCLRFEIVFP